MNAAKPLFRHRRPAWLLSLLCALAASPGMADEARANEVKAAFLLNIARFVYWPAHAFEQHPGEIHLCAWRENPLGEALTGLQGKKIAGRSLIVQTIQEADALSGCNILFFPADAHTPYAQSPLPAHSTLLSISDLTQYQEDHSFGQTTQIALIRQRNRIGFQIDRSRMSSSLLTLSSELLKLGRILDERR